MGIELDMEILDLLDRILLHDGDAVDQQLRRHQRAVEEHGVMRRDPERPMRNIRTERAGAEPDQQHVAPPFHEPPVIAAPANPPSPVAPGPHAFVTLSPMRRFSTGTSPAGVRIIVPRQ